MKTSQQQNFRKMITNSKTVNEHELSYHRDIATQAMLLSFIDPPVEIMQYNDKESNSYILGYN